VLTDENGCFELDEFHSVFNDKLIVEDIDGEDNGGEFQSDTIKVWDLPKKQIEKGSGWYEGKYEVTANIKLKKK
jgi:putative lipoprotein (rSAM/lipoprotein system)